MFLSGVLFTYAMSTKRGLENFYKQHEEKKVPISKEAALTLTYLVGLVYILTPILNSYSVFRWSKKIVQKLAK